MAVDAAAHLREEEVGVLLHPRSFKDAGDDLVWSVGVALYVHICSLRAAHHPAHDHHRGGGHVLGTMISDLMLVPLGIRKSTNSTSASRKS
jgi:hypothetical protein